MSDLEGQDQRLYQLYSMLAEVRDEITMLRESNEKIAAVLLTSELFLGVRNAKKGKENTMPEITTKMYLKCLKIIKEAENVK